MFQDLFDTQEEINTGVREGQVQSAWDRLPRTCADTLPLPQLPRKQGYPIGLKNQGATCYLNSLLQILFHTPELRKTILDLPLCKGSIQEKSQFLNGGKHKFMMGFQKLFSEMSLKNTNSIQTDYLKDAFGWEGTEHIVQHDIGEAMKVIFDTFERALQNTQFEKNIKDLFRGVSSRYKTCKSCTVTSQRPQDFYGLDLQVQGYKSLQDSMMTFLNAESMDGDNKVFCDTCQSKQDMWLGTKLKVLPNVLVFSLTRFAFDYERFDRIKLNSFFSFNLETNLSHLIDDQEANASESDHGCEYELYGVLIHRGSAHSGHYFCFIRDIMQECNWKSGLQQAEKLQQERKQKEAKDKEAIMTQQQKERNQEKNRQQKSFHLVQPENKALLQNWFCLDDSVVTAIEAKKITTKYEGSDSAYILFYRRRNVPLPEKVKAPEYFSSIISSQNEVLQKQREAYDIKKNQIILKIDGNDEMLNVNSKIKDIIDIYCGHGFTLVNQAKHNGLPYYPKEINSFKEYSDDDTVKSMDLIHESVWKKYEIDSDEYRNIQPYIEVGRMPFEINVYFNEKNEKMVLYQDQTLTNLKLKIQKKYDIPYQAQIIKLVTAYRQYFVTDDLSNDDVLLTKLGFIHQCQVVLKKLEAGDTAEDAKKVQQKVQTNTICFVIERDDIYGIKRMYFDKSKTLKQLFDFMVESQSLDKETVRRFRNLNGDRLFYNDQYNKTLEELRFDQEIVKLRIERGQVPIKGDICIIAKMQSKFQKQGAEPLIQIIVDPNETIVEAKTKICEIAGLIPQMHRLYQADWTGEPVRCITRQNQSVFDAKFGKQEKICVRDIQSPIGAELIPLQVYQTKIGTPQDVRQPITQIKIEQHKTLKDLKEEILKTNICKDKQLKIGQIRVREIKKDYMFGAILRDNNKQLKNYTFNTNKIVVQILPEEQQLNDNQIVLVLKKRNKEKRLFEGHTQFVFDAGKAPTIQDLFAGLHKRLQIPLEQKLKIAKYVNYDFQWFEINEKEIDKFLKSKTSKQTQNQNKHKTKDTKKDNKKKQGKKHEQKNEKAPKVQEKGQNQIKTEDTNNQSTQAQHQAHNKEQKDNKNQKTKHENKKVEGDQPKQKKQKAKNEGKGKNKGQQKPKQELKRQDCLNLRKAPYLLKEGDWIGYGKVTQLEGDDFQTDEDLTLKVLKKNEKAVAKRRKGPEVQFTIKSGF